MKGIGDLMKQAQQVQEKMQALQVELAQLEVTGEAGAGLVKVTLNGRHEARRVEIDPSLANEDRAVLEDLIAAAINDAVNRVDQQTQARMANVMSGVALPPGFKLPF